MYSTLFMMKEEFRHFYCDYRCTACYICISCIMYKYTNTISVLVFGSCFVAKHMVNKSMQHKIISTCQIKRMQENKTMSKIIFHDLACFLTKWGRLKAEGRGKLLSVVSGDRTSSNGHFAVLKMRFKCKKTLFYCEGGPRVEDIAQRPWSLHPWRYWELSCMVQGDML